MKMTSPDYRPVDWKGEYVDRPLVDDLAVVLSSILPASDYPWKPGMDPGPKIAALNAWLKAYAEKNHVVYLDYYAAMVDNKLGLAPELAKDGVHPTPAGYAIMAPLAEKAIAEALKKK